MIRFWQIAFFVMAACFFFLWGRISAHECPKPRPVILKPASVPQPYETRVI